MAAHLLALPEILAMLQAVKVSQASIDRFEKQALFVLEKRAPLTREDEDFQVGSGYDHFKRRGHVKFKTGTIEHQMEPKKAKLIGHWLIEAAEAAISDATVMALMRDRVGIEDSSRLAQILLDLREFRQGTRDVVYEN